MESRALRAGREGPGPGAGGGPGDDVADASDDSADDAAHEGGERALTAPAVLTTSVGLRSYASTSSCTRRILTMIPSASAA